jgi:hypothetical protein
VSLYYVQKFLYELNRDAGLQSRFRLDGPGELAPYDLTDEERQALLAPDIGLLYHLGVNGQILMHFAAFHQIEWADYLQRMRDGIATHGPVREGVYAMTGYRGVEAHAADLGHTSPMTAGPTTASPTTAGPATAGAVSPSADQTSSAAEGGTGKGTN